MTLVKDMVERKLRAARSAGNEGSLLAEPLRAHRAPEICLRAIEARVEKLSRAFRGVTFALAKLDLAAQSEVDAATDATRRELLREMFRSDLPG